MGRLDTFRGQGIPAGVSYALDAQLRDLIEGRVWDFFVYSTPNPIGPIGPGDTGRGDITVEKNATFLIIGATLTILDNDDQDSVLDDPATVQVHDSGSGRDLFSAAQHARNVFGTGQRPCYWPFYRKVEPASTLSVTFTSLDPALDLLVFPSFLGIKVFGPGISG
jgi:hypothetical protein